MTDRISFLGIPIDSLTMKETLALVDSSIREKRYIHHVVVNAAKVVNLKKHRELEESIINCDIINPDGQSIIWASRFLGKNLPERVAGIDLMINLVEMAAREGYRIFLLGAKKEVLNRVVELYEKKYGPDLIVGYRDGYYRQDEEYGLAYQIASSNADMLFVAMTSPKKEIFLHTYKDIIRVPFIMGVGGSFDVISGITKRAPVWMQKAGMEWFYRLIQEPRRMWKRYLLSNSQFLYLVFREKLRQIIHL